ncbi:thiolase-like protein [Peniophora sp. CONT]|nr:thiolase-like protein [Peniophora sp. CONT]
MNLTNDPVCIIGTACRLPGGIVRPDGLFKTFASGYWQDACTSTPQSRGFSLFDGVRGASDSSFGQGGWLGEEGLEQFDPEFFHISASEADNIRPNVRLALELTWEALEHAGIPPSTLRGRNVSVSFGVGTEDGWDMQRVKKEDGLAFDEHWAASSDPSSVSGRVSHCFGFRGTSTTVATACASGGFALREGIISLCHEDAEVAIIGSMATHFNPSPFAWAAASGVISRSGRSSAFSPKADGYSPSEGAVVFVLKRLTSAQKAGDVIHAQIRSLASAHNGATRTMFTPSAESQTELLRRTQLAARIGPEDIDICEAHGTGTQVGDALEAEAIRNVFAGSRAGSPLLLSSAKTMLGHCHGSAALVGILKVLACFSHRAVPPHGLQPAKEFLEGPILIPTTITPIKSSRILAQVNAAGFTGSIVSVVLETGPSAEHSSPETSPANPTSHAYFLPFSHKCSTQLDEQIKAVRDWAARTRCPLPQLAAILGLCRDHHQFRKAFVASSLDNLMAADCAQEIVEPLDKRWSAEALVGDKTTAYTGGSNLLAFLCRLYERGDTLPFDTVYDKKTINPTWLSTFPFYLFNRRRCWKDVAATRSPSEARLGFADDAPASRLDRLPHYASYDDDHVFTDLICQYGAPFPQHRRFTPKTALSVPSRSCILLTGANGMLGARFLNILIQLPSITVCCPIRGDGWRRLQASFAAHELDNARLQAAHARGAVRIFPVQDLCAPQLGLSTQDYSWLCRHIDQVVHAAWMVNFNLPLSEFRGLLRCTRELAELCLLATKRVRYFFIGTHASTFGYEGQSVPEYVIPPRQADAIQQASGYAIAKLVAEHALLSIAKATGDILDLAIVRIGQICGDTVNGAWSTDEMMPMFISSLPVLRALPESAPDVAWIPSDTCAAVLRDFILSPRTSTHRPVVLHIAHPIVLPWSDVAHEMARIAGVEDFKLVSMHDFVYILRAHLAKSNTSIAIARLLPFFDSIADKAPQQHFAPLEVTASRRLSRALDNCPPITGRLLETIVDHGLRGVSCAVPDRSHLGHLFIFGPAVGSADAVSPNPETISRVMEIATSTAGLRIEELNEDPVLERQLRTIAMQMDSVEDMRARGIVPSVVTGYCFGEYAAAIVAGILTFDCAIQILVQRARAVRGIDGALLNAFTDTNTVSRALASLAHPPAIAIVAGPTHVVLSGSLGDVRAAEQALGRTGVKCFCIPAQLPFHSPLMNAAASALQIQQLPTALTQDVRFVSGVAGIVLPPDRVTASYWKRHMCTRINFYRAMCTARQFAPRAQIVDVGPGKMVARMISRYGDGWEAVNIVVPQDASQSQVPPPTPPPTSSSSPKTAQIPSVHLPLMTKGRNREPKAIALTLLAEMLGHEPSEALLPLSLHALGIQSMDFVRFSERLSVEAGIQVSMSAYVSDIPLGKILENGSSAM